MCQEHHVCVGGFLLLARPLIALSLYMPFFVGNRGTCMARGCPSTLTEYVQNYYHGKARTVWLQ